MASNYGESASRKSLITLYLDTDLTDLSASQIRGVYRFRILTSTHVGQSWLTHAFLTRKFAAYIPDT